jgi:hypothetical protein
MEITGRKRPISKRKKADYVGGSGPIVVCTQFNRAMEMEIEISCYTRSGIQCHRTADTDHIHCSLHKEWEKKVCFFCHESAWERVVMNSIS